MIHHSSDQSPKGTPVPGEWSGILGVGGQCYLNIDYLTFKKIFSPDKVGIYRFLKYLVRLVFVSEVNIQLLSIFVLGTFDANMTLLTKNTWHVFIQQEQIPHNLK